jgi:hypothetical protein
MKNVVIGLGKHGQLGIVASDNGFSVKIAQPITRDTCDTCGNEWCCNPDHGPQPDPANADDLAHHECVDRIRYNGALDGIEAFLMVQIAAKNEIPSHLKDMLIQTLDALGNNIYG